MRTTVRILQGHVHRPLIRFLGKRHFPSSLFLFDISSFSLILPFVAPDSPHPHPAAPADIVTRFKEFQKRSNSSTPSSLSLATRQEASGSRSYQEFWEAPARFWKSSRIVEDVEMDAVLVSPNRSYIKNAVAVLRSLKCAEWRSISSVES